MRLTLSRRVTHLPFRQFRSTLSRSQYTVFQGLVSLISREISDLVPLTFPLLARRRGLLPLASPSESLTSTLNRLTSLINDPFGLLPWGFKSPPTSSARIFASFAIASPTKVSSLVLAFDPSSSSSPCECPGCDSTPLITAGLRSCSSTFSRFRSSIGSPHPHFSHFRSMCWPHIRRQRRSSSASAFQDFDTCAARPREMASRYPRVRRFTSRGRREKGSIRMISLSESDKWDN